LPAGVAGHGFECVVTILDGVICDPGLDAEAGYRAAKEKRRHGTLGTPVAGYLACQKAAKFLRVLQCEIDCPKGQFSIMVVAASCAKKLTLIVTSALRN
jgi:hypothetical protein